MEKPTAPDKLVLLIIGENGGRLRGKTLLQKRAYFLSKILNLDLGYRAHYYGPYSPEIEDGLARAKALGFVEEQTLGYGMTDQVGFEVRRYDYTLTEDGKEIISRLWQQHSTECEKIQKALKSLIDAGDNGDYVSLSVAAKTSHIIAEKNSEMTSVEIRSAAKDIGWNIDETSISKAETFLRKLEMVKK